MRQGALVDCAGFCGIQEGIGSASDFVCERMGKFVASVLGRHGDTMTRHQLKNSDVYKLASISCAKSSEFLLEILRFAFASVGGKVKDNLSSGSS